MAKKTQAQQPEALSISVGDAGVVRPAGLLESPNTRATLPSPLGFHAEEASISQRFPGAADDQKGR